MKTLVPGRHAVPLVRSAGRRRCGGARVGVAAFAAIIAALVCAVPCPGQSGSGAAPASGDPGSGRSAAYDSYFDYLSYHRNRIDGELHPDPDHRAAANRLAELSAAAAGALDVRALRTAIKRDRIERELVLSHLAAETTELPAQLLEARAQLAVARGRAAGDSGDGDAQGPASERVERLAARAAWLAARNEFFQSEHAALDPRPAAARRGVDLYWDLLELEKLRRAAEVAGDAASKQLAEAKVAVREGELAGHTLEGARAALGPREAARAVTRLDKLLEPIPRRLDALAFHPEERAKLAEFEKLYRAEAEALSAIARRSPR